MFQSSAAFFDELYAFRDMRAEARSALRLARDFGRRRARSVLDVGCSTGDHAAHIRRAGVPEVWGIDLDKSLLRQARSKHPDVRFVLGDAQTMRLDRMFDCIVSFYGVIAYAKTLRGLSRFVRSVERHLAPTGVAVIEPWHLRGTFVAKPSVRHIVTPSMAIARTSVAQVKEGRVRLDVHYLVARGTRVTHLRERHDVALYTKAELLDAFADVGLTPSWRVPGPSGRGVIVARRT